jgi:hypothetical protein
MRGKSEKRLINSPLTLIATATSSFPLEIRLFTNFPEGGK